MEKSKINITAGRIKKYAVFDSNNSLIFFISTSISKGFRGGLKPLQV
jgi:hypothetical protein